MLPKLPCPVCGHRFSRVIESRTQPIGIDAQLNWGVGDGIWRRRVCTTCHAIYPTKEHILRRTLHLVHEDAKTRTLD